MITYGTCCFPSLAHAVKYYEQQGTDQAAVRELIEEGSILIGKPFVYPGEKLVLLDDGLRYGVEVEEKKA